VREVKRESPPVAFFLEEYGVRASYSFEEKERGGLRHTRVGVPRVRWADNGALSCLRR